MLGGGIQNTGIEAGSLLASSFKFFMYDDEPINMELAEKCFRSQHSLDRESDPDGHNLDRNVRLMQREHLAELWLLSQLRSHPRRTHNPDKADLFFIGYAPCLARLVDRQGQHCSAIPEKVNRNTQIHIFEGVRGLGFRVYSLGFRV
jgi:hypothetical protein